MNELPSGNQFEIWDRKCNSILSAPEAHGYSATIISQRTIELSAIFELDGYFASFPLSTEADCATTNLGPDTLSYKLGKFLELRNVRATYLKRNPPTIEFADGQWIDPDYREGLQRGGLPLALVAFVTVTKPTSEKEHAMFLYQPNDMSFLEAYSELSQLALATLPDAQEAHAIFN